MVNPVNGMTSAISAYNQALKGASGERTPVSDTPAAGGFADLVRGAVEEAVKTGAGSEQVTAQAVQNSADLNQVVTAVAEADLTLQTVVAVRDRVIEAYKDIVRMPI
jgi:flagellar hook-basal body complex protein FliE